MMPLQSKRFNGCHEDHWKQTQVFPFLNDHFCSWIQRHVDSSTNRRLTSVCCQCNNDYVPVCGSNGESYQNECYLRQAACKQQSEILVVSEGSCATGMYGILKTPWNLLKDSESKKHVLFLLSSPNNLDYILARQAFYSFV